MASMDSSFFSTLTCVEMRMARVAANGEGCEAATSRLGSMSSTSAGTPTTRPGRRGPTEGTSRKMRGVRSTTATRRTPAPRLLLAGLADAYGTTMGVARHNNLVAHEDQLLVAVEAGRVVGGARVSVRLAGGRRHRPQRWRRGCPTGAMSVCRSHGGWRASVGCRMRVTTQRPRVQRTQKRVLRRQFELRLRRRTAALGGRWTQ